MSFSLFSVHDEPRVPPRTKGEPLDAYVERVVEELVAELREHAIQLNNNASGIVDTYADLPAAAESEGRIYYLRTAGGGPPAGNWYGSDGTNWKLLG